MGAGPSGGSSRASGIADGRRRWGPMPAGERRRRVGAGAIGGWRHGRVEKRLEEESWGRREGRRRVGGEENAGTSKRTDEETTEPSKQPGIGRPKINGTNRTVKTDCIDVANAALLQIRLGLYRRTSSPGRALARRNSATAHIVLWGIACRLVCKSMPK